MIFDCTHSFITLPSYTLLLTPLISLIYPIIHPITQVLYCHPCYTPTNAPLTPLTHPVCTHLNSTLVTLLLTPLSLFSHIL